MKNQLKARLFQRGNVFYEWYYKEDNPDRKQIRYAFYEGPISDHFVVSHCDFHNHRILDIAHSESEAIQKAYESAKKDLLAQISPETEFIDETHSGKGLLGQMVQNPSNPQPSQTP